MERRVQERLVGAAVLMAAAIILIPEMLSGPERHPEQVATRAGSDSHVKTYTIDLADPSAAKTKDTPSESAPPPEEPFNAESKGADAPADPVSAVAADQALPESGSAPVPESLPRSETGAESKPAPSVPVRTHEPAPQQTAEPAPTVPAPQKQLPRSHESADTPPLASSATVPTTKGWAVQLGSFSNAASAQRLATEFRAERFDAFVMPVTTGGATLYRVRLGPMKDRAAAEDALKRARAKVAGATVVAHP